MSTKIDNTERRLHYLKKIFDFPKEFNINNNNINNIYFKIPEWCCTYVPEPLFKDIGPFEWNKMIEIIVKVYESEKEVDTRFFSTIPKYEMKTLNVTIDDIMMNCMILNYVKCRPKIKILTQFSNMKLDFKDANLYATKTIKLSINAIEVLIYQLFCLTDKFKSYDMIQDYVKLILQNSKSKICKVYVYEGDTELNIDNTCDFISTDFITAINHSEIFFNKNSLELLDTMLLERFLSRKFDRSRLMINTFKKMLLVRKLTLLEQSKFLLLAGSVLAIHGIRRSSDIDFFISNLPESADTSTISKITDIFMKDNEKLFFFDGYHPKVRWEEFWSDWHKEWAGYFGANSMLECVHNPKYHFYFCGVKCIILQAEIERRNIRSRPAAVVDLIMINRLLNKSIKLKPIKNDTIKNNIIKNKGKSEFINTMNHWIKKKYDTILTEEELSSLVFL
jgi:hypothetical protein